MDWKKYYNEHLVSAKEAITNIHDGDTIITSFGCGEPFAIEDALEENYKDFHDVKIINMLSFGSIPWAKPEMKGHIRYGTFFASASSRAPIANNACDFIPSNFSEIPSSLKSIIKPRVSIVSVCPPDEDGYVSLGTSVDYIESTLHYTELKIAQVNENIPRTAGDARKHVSDFDFFVEDTRDLPQIPMIPLTDAEKEIGKNCASLINDGACIQLGIGGIPNAICEELKSKKDLGLHSEMVGDGVVELLQKGIINNSKKNIDKGVSVLGFTFGTTKLNDYINNNENVIMRSIDYVNDPYVIAQNDNFVSVNSALQIDLLGQVVSDTIGEKQFSGTGGQVDFVRGATRSKNGITVIAMTSTTKHGTISKIVPKITEGSAITTSRNDVNFVVTEFGIASLKGKNNNERAKELIKIAHPKFRKELEKEYSKKFDANLT